MSYVPPRSWLCNPLNTSKYLKLDKDERKSFRVTTKIEDDAELDQHILDVQAQAYKIFPYPCIRIFGFTRIRISRLPAYKHFMKLGIERKNPIFIDLGCAFGSDLRKAVVDGYPVESCLATDLHGGEYAAAPPGHITIMSLNQTFWSAMLCFSIITLINVFALLTDGPGLYKEGHNLFRDTPDTFPVPFIQGDVFDPAFLAITEPMSKDAAPTEPAPALQSLTTSLNPLRGHVSAVYMGKFLHLFDEAGQAHLAKALAGLLSPAPGSILFGVQGALEERGPFAPAGSDWTMFCHSPESLGTLFEDAFGGPGTIRFESRMVEEPGGPTHFDTWPGNPKPFTCQEWSVVRL